MPLDPAPVAMFLKRGAQSALASAQAHPSHGRPQRHRREDGRQGGVGRAQAPWAEHGTGWAPRTGKEEDSEVGLQYFGKRYLNPLLGRWISADPLAVHAPGEADLNLYAYVSGSVLKAVDPMGLKIELAMTSAEDRAATLALLQSLTSDKLQIREEKVTKGGGCDRESTTTRYFVERVGSEGESAKLKGTELVGRLVGSEHTVAIRVGAENHVDRDDAYDAAANRDASGKAGAGRGSMVNLALHAEEHEVQVAVEGQSGGAKWEKQEKKFSLAHELVHAERFERGVGAMYEGIARNERNPEFNELDPARTAVGVEELETIGIGDHQSEITENDIRAEQGAAQRVSHSGREQASQ